MRGFVVFIILAFILGIGYLLHHDQSVITEQGKRIEKLSAELAANKSEQKGASLEYQEKCAAQAKRTFDELGYKARKLAGYENHYNAKMNRCFVEIDDTDTSYSPTIWTHKILQDAYEGKMYGQYHWHTMKDKKYWEVPPFQCKVLSLSGEDQSCNSDEEYETLIKVYMEN
jgi:hypothetical protein